MPMERSLIDKAINGALLGKRKIGRPIRYNLRQKGKQGYVVRCTGFQLQSQIKTCKVSGDCLQILNIFISFV